MTGAARFCVIYRFRLRDGMESRFKECWSRVTEAIRDTRGGLGSRLHKASDGTWAAYAQWPDRETWARSQQMDAIDDAEAIEMMASAIAERLPPILLETQVDLLVPSLAASQSHSNAS